MKTVNVYINHENDDLETAFISWFRSFGYRLSYNGQELHIKRMEFEKEES